ncbi:hypothetical protein FA13DRAFT_1004316 [Coprinellus micaceus]|uniref:Uncharacterized protein n=1 Tax=Coprinellus micaceus TaxID=71717 RepID=A0A4Y7RQ07_COPMI|nr:hypothetical protein FA13DRAFT_1004316 [Coprinellus micaceus]
MFLRSFEVKDTLPPITNFLTSIKVMAAFKITSRIEGGSEPFPLLDQCFGALPKAWVGPPNSSRARGEAQKLELRRWSPTCRWPPQLNYFFGQWRAMLRAAAFCFRRGSARRKTSLIAHSSPLQKHLAVLKFLRCLYSNCFGTPQSIWNSVLGLLPNFRGDNRSSRLSLARWSPFWSMNQMLIPILPSLLYRTFGSLERYTRISTYVSQGNSRLPSFL